ALRAPWPGGVFICFSYDSKLHALSFSTRLSSDLYADRRPTAAPRPGGLRRSADLRMPPQRLRVQPFVAPRRPMGVRPCGCGPARAEEHTSALQSRENLVCRLLLEKKKFIAVIATA